MSYFGGSTNAAQASNLTFPSYNNQHMNQRNSLSSLSSAPNDKLNQPPNLSNIKNRPQLPLPQDSQHHQSMQQNALQSQGSALNAPALLLLNSAKSLPESFNANLNALTKMESDSRGSSSPDHPKKRERKNRPGQKFGAKKKSWVWSWFVQDSQDPNIAACDYCGKVITRLASDKGSPKKLSEHLKTHKLDMDSINTNRSIPVDGHGITYSHNGSHIGFVNIPQGQNVPPQSKSPNPQNDTAATTLNDSLKPKHDALNSGYSLNNNNRRFLSADFDNSPYTAMKFHRHLIKFLVENKLSINVIHSHTFQQLIYDLRSDSMTDLLELTGLYKSLLEVSRYTSNGSVPSVDEANMVNTIAQHVEQKNNSTLN